MVDVAPTWAGWDDTAPIPVVPPAPAAAPSAAGPRRGRALRMPALRRTPAGPAQASGRRHRAAVWHAVALSMITLAVLAAWAVVYGFAFSSVQEHRSQHELLASFREKLALETAPVTDPIGRGAPVASLAIPAIGVHNLVVVEGTNAADLEAGPGHRPDTVLPGQVGVSVLMGRSVSFGAPFGRIVDLRAGALIEVETGQGSFEYRVTDVRRNGDPLPYPIPDGSGRLTLVTSAPTGGFFSSRQTVYVDATLQGHAQAADSGRRSAIPDAEAPMKGNAGALGALVIWLVLLVVAVVLAVWARTAWGTRPTVLVGLPIVIALVWAIMGVAAQLLPNLL